MVAQWVKDLTDDVLGPSVLCKGYRFVHPEHGVCVITGGQYWGTHGISNHWHWEDAEGTKHHGYGMFDVVPAPPIEVDVDLSEYVVQVRMLDEDGTPFWAGWDNMDTLEKAVAYASELNEKSNDPDSSMNADGMYHGFRVARVRTVVTYEEVI